MNRPSLIKSYYGHIYEKIVNVLWFHEALAETSYICARCGLTDSTVIQLFIVRPVLTTSETSLCSEFISKFCDKIMEKGLQPARCTSSARSMLTKCIELEEFTVRKSVRHAFVPQWVKTVRLFSPLDGSVAPRMWSVNNKHCETVRQRLSMSYKLQTTLLH